MICLSELRGLGAVQEELQARGGRVLAVSVDSPQQSLQVVEQLKLNFAILSDRGAAVLGQYGLVHQRGGREGETIALPAQLLIDRDGRIIWRRVSARIQDRPNPAEVIRVIRKLKGS